MTPSIEVLNEDCLLNTLNYVTEGKMAKTWLAEIQWKDGHVRRSYLKVFSKSLELGLLNEITGYILAKKAGLPLPIRAGLLKLPPDMFPESKQYLSYGFISSEVPGQSPNSIYNIGEIATQAQLKPIVDLIRSWKYLPDCMAFDDWTANTDRHFGNVIFSGAGDLYIIDHSNLPVTTQWKAEDLKDETSYENRLATLINFTDQTALPKKMEVSRAAMEHPKYYTAAYSELKHWWDLLLESDGERRMSLERFIENRAKTGHLRICTSLQILEV